MDFDYSAKTKELQKRIAAFMDEHIYPAEAAYTAELEANTTAGKRWTPLQTIEELKPKAARRACGTCSCRRQRRGLGLRRRRPHEPGLRAAGRDHGPRAVGQRGLQLLGARHRQHGDDRALRHRRAQGALARAAARRQDPQRLRDDRAGGRLVRRDQHRGAHRAPGRRVRHQRPQVVDHRRRRPALQDLHLHGQDRSRRAAPFAAVDDPGAGRRQGHQHPAPALGVRLRRRAARPHGDALRERARAGRQHPARRRPRLRDRAGPPRARAASTTACA